MRKNLLAVILAAIVAGATPVAAQQPRALSAADYAHAEAFLQPTAGPLVIGGSVAPNWLADESFWYRNTTAEGYDCILVDPARRARAPAFDHARLAAALSAAAGEKYTAGRLPT